MIEHTSTVVYALFKLISDQYGTSELVGIYSQERYAQYQGEHVLRKERTWIKPFVLDLPVGAYHGFTNTNN